MAIPVIVIFDIGKTNKKFFLLDEDLNKISEEYLEASEVTDDDGFACDDLHGLTAWIRETVRRVADSPHYDLKALNFSTYGATLVHLDGQGQTVTPLYNYLKPYPEDLLDEFYNKYPEDIHNLETASPNLGMLNSGLQLYWLKKRKKEIFSRIKYTLHFPQYLSWLFTGKMVSEPTSIGCHTKLWDFTRNDYHRWVRDEGLTALFPEIVPASHFFKCMIGNREVRTGVGIHDSSAALAAYMQRESEPFILLSTGTWSIALNPFTTEELTKHQLQRDCLHYMTIQGKPVKASRLFLGHELDEQINHLSKLFHKDSKYIRQIRPDQSFIRQMKDHTIENSFYPSTIANPLLTQEVFNANDWHPENFSTCEEAYHHLMWGLVKLQGASLKLAMGNTPVRKIYIDGGFTSNELFIQLLKYYLPDHTIEISEKPLGSAYGAAMVIGGATKN